MPEDFVVARNPDPEAMSIGLSNGQAAAVLVNSSRDGGGKATWVV